MLCPLLVNSMEIKAVYAYLQGDKELAVSSPTNLAEETANLAEETANLAKGYTDYR